MTLIASFCGQEFCSAHSRFWPSSTWRCSGCPALASGDPRHPKPAPTACLLTFCCQSLFSRDLLMFLLQVWPRSINFFFFLHFPLPPTAADHSKARKGWVHPHVRPRPAAARGADALSACGALSRDASSPTSSFCTFGACSLTFTDKGLLLHLHNLHDS